MAGYSKVQSDNKHLQNMNSAKYLHVDGSSTDPIVVVPATKGCSLLRVILNTNGSTLRLRTGSRVVAVIASDALEGSFPYGVWCENGLIAECGGSLDATIVFDSI